MENKIPIVFTQLLDLQKFRVAPTSVAWQNITIGDRFMCVRDGGNVNMFDFNNLSQPDVRPIKADSTIMHPTESILALRAGSLLQVHRLHPESSMIGELNLSGVEFWKWIDDQRLVLVTATHVSHWNVTLNSVEKMFDRATQLNAHQIVDYQLSHDKKYLALVGLAAANGRTVGHVQLYSVDQKGSHPIDAHACCFMRLKKPGAPDGVLFCFAQRNDGGSGLLWSVEMGGQGHKVSEPLLFSDANPLDFPLALIPSHKYAVLYLLTREGFFYLCDSLTCKKIMANKISNDPLLLGSPYVSSSGVVTVNTAGLVLVITVNEQLLVPFLLSQNEQKLAVSLAQRGNLPGLEVLFQQQFQLYMQAGQYQNAAKLVAESARGCLRTPQTLMLFKSLPTTPTSSPMRDYFTTLLEYGQLNEAETMELVQPTIAQGRKDLILDWLAKDKLFCTPALGRLIVPLDSQAALTIFEKCDDKDEIAQLYADTGDYKSLVEFTKAKNYRPNWMSLLQGTINHNPAGAITFATMLLRTHSGPLIDINQVIDAFLEKSLIKEISSLLLDFIENKPEHGELQTRLLEINLKTVGCSIFAEAIMSKNLFSHYDFEKIAKLCEQAGMYQRALQHFTDITQVRRLLVAYGTTMQPEFVGAALQRFTGAERLDLLRDLLKTSLSSIPLVAAICVRFTPPPGQADPNQFTPRMVIPLFEEFESYEGVFAYLKPIIPIYYTDKDVVFKFIEASARLGMSKEVELAVRDYEYNPEVVMEFLKEVRIDSQLPLVFLCDKHGYVSDLTKHLFRNNMHAAIESYVQQINPLKTPEVVSALIDENCPEERIKALIASVGHLCPVDGLVKVMESHNRLLMLHSWLEARFNEHNKEPATHNALAKILIASSDERSESFLLNNDIYDPIEVGKFAEANNPNLALKIYQSRKCHQELIRFTTANAMWREQARYLCYEQNLELWAQVLASTPENNESRKSLIASVSQIIPEVKPDQSGSSNSVSVVSTTVQAFMNAKLPSELMELLEKIVLGNDGFNDNKNLQNLLILTAIKADKKRVMNYVLELNGYDPNDMATMALSYKIPDVAFAIYKKFSINGKAIEVLVKHLNQNNNLAQAVEFAEACKEPAVYSVLASAQLANGQVLEAIQSFIKAGDSDSYEAVITSSKKGEHYEELVKFLTMARSNQKHNSQMKTKERIDSELVYAYAKTKSPELEFFIKQPHSANLQNVGDLCFSEHMYDSARIIFEYIKKWSSLVSCLIKLKNFAGAVEYARHANLISTWKEVYKSCIDAEPPEFRLAQFAAMNIINNPGPDLEELVEFYEVRGYISEIIQLLESGINTDTNISLATVLGVLYSKHRPDKLYSHLQLFKKKLNISKLINVVRENLQFSELSYLHELENDFDNAIRVMIDHPEVWQDLKFKELIGKVKLLELIYDAIKFYLQFFPSKTVELLSSVSTKLEPARVVNVVQKLGHLPVVKKYLEQIQEKDIREVNNALHDLYIDEEDFDSLRASVSKYQNFDSLALAKRLSNNDLLEFKRIASQLYKLNKRWKQSIELSKVNKLYKDAMETAAESKEREVAEELIHFFVDPANQIPNAHQTFAACLYTCYELIRPDVALELAWKYKMLDFVFPYFIQFLKDYTHKVDELYTLHQGGHGQALGADPAHLQQQQLMATGGMGVVPGMMGQPVYQVSPSIAIPNPGMIGVVPMNMMPGTAIPTRGILPPQMVSPSPVLNPGIMPNMSTGNRI